MTQKTAHLYRMVMPDHLCPYGLKSKSLLERHGYVILDHHLTNRAETDAFKAEHGVKTTPRPLSKTKGSVATTICVVSLANM